MLRLALTGIEDRLDQRRFGFVHGQGGTWHDLLPKEKVRRTDRAERMSKGGANQEKGAVVRRVGISSLTGISTKEHHRLRLIVGNARNNGRSWIIDPIPGIGDAKEEAKGIGLNGSRCEE